jgi:tetratricopeptide (TPR) repeat protein
VLMLAKLRRRTSYLIRGRLWHPRDVANFSSGRYGPAYGAWLRRSTVGVERDAVRGLGRNHGDGEGNARNENRPAHPDGKPRDDTTSRPSQITGDRVVRVFVSSTFRDMQADRDELVKRTFPALRKLCASRGVVWSQVDLRWGITGEQAAEGKVLPICLAEIERSRPYFIGLLGERYGWVPDVIAPELVEREPWLSAHAGHSVTELEIVHGVLGDPSMVHHAFFYLRDLAYVEGKAPDVYCEIATPDEIERLGAEEAERRAVERRAQLVTLKERICSSGLPVRMDYPDTQTLGELVLADLTSVIERLYPLDSKPDALASEAAEHEAFAVSRAQVYIARPADFGQLDAHAAGEDLPLVVEGESGLGKSALLANWARTYRERDPETPVLLHFAGASAQSSNWASMVRRLMGEMSRQMGFTIEIPDELDALRVGFANALHMAAAKGRLILVIDALNQLEDRDGALELTWLPPLIPAGIRLIVSSLPGRTLDEAHRRGWSSLKVAPLDAAERRHLIADYLAQAAHRLSDDRVNRIATAPQSANPLFLRTLLDELLVWGNHDTLDQAISLYLSADSVVALFELILQRFERDYERDRPHLVRDAFSLMWASRGGLAESELLDMLGSEGQPLPGAHWSPLFLAAEQSLTSRSGLLGFSHDFLRQAVGRRYLPTDQERTAAHRRLADYLAARDIEPRKVRELPWQWAQAGEWQRLYDLLADLAFFEAAWTTDEFEVKASWAQVEASSPLRLLDAYSRVLAAPADCTKQAVSGVAGLLRDTGHSEQALQALEHVLSRSRSTGDLTGLAATLGELATVLYLRGDLDRASVLFEEQERTCDRLNDKKGLGVSLGGQAALAGTAGDLNKSMALSKRRERLCREEYDWAGLQDSLGAEAQAMWGRSRPEEAMALAKEQERTCLEAGLRTGIAQSLSMQALIVAETGMVKEAQRLLDQAATIYGELGDRVAVALLLDNKAYLLKMHGRFDEALALQQELVEVFRASGNMPYLATALGNQAATLALMGRHREALELADDAYTTSENVGLALQAQEVRSLIDVLRAKN